MSITIEAAVIEEQGVKFAVVSVKPHVLQNSAESEQMMQALRSPFPGVPIVLAAAWGSGEIRYRGRPDLIRFLETVPWDLLPWGEYSWG